VEIAIESRWLKIFIFLKIKLERKIGFVFKRLNSPPEEGGLARLTRSENDNVSPLFDLLN
jgi:hypothetical protein